MDLRALIQAHPHALHISASSVGALVGMGSVAPSFVPVIFTVASLLLYAPILFHRPHRVTYTALLWLSITVCSAFARIAPALNALSTAGPSVAVLLAMSSISSALAILTIFLDVFISRRTGTPQVVLFPAIWTTLWAAMAQISLGRLTAWSPVLGTQSYQWLAPWLGPAGIDWIVAAWAVVLSQSIGIWYMGTPADELLDGEILEDVIQQTSSKAGSSGISAGTLGLILTALTVPSSILSSTPLPVTPPETVTPFRVGCALPAFSKHHSISPGIEEYIHESQTLEDASLVLWPEGAVTFRNESERDIGLKYIQTRITTRRPYWAVSFKETISDPSDASGRTSMSRIGLAVLSNFSTEPHMIYYKRYLVPIAESYHFTPGLSPPPLFPLQLRSTTDKKKKKQEPDRSVDITASICLDLAMPAPFQDLDSRPGLILAPAHTWDRAIGSRMWEEVKQRANEIGSLALWCDGGEGGVSGVAGAGYNEIYQAGEGTWSRTVGIPHPFDQTRTFYARHGEISAVAFAWFFVVGPVALLTALKRSKRTGLPGFALRGVDWVRTRVGRGKANSAEQPNLIDWEPSGPSS